jgi:serine/threonine protein kinase/tetratricopeptide (TPR) repeat protein
MREESIFAGALELLSPAERAEFLDKACAGDSDLRMRVEALLRADQQSGDLLDPPDGPLIPKIHVGSGAAAGLVAQALSQPTIAEGPGTRIGPYKLLQSIGEGGMGVVFMAEQETPVRRKVALKVIKPGMDSALVIARFEAERQALALMDHNNIARVYDAGTTDSGRPYFVMELVHGIPITEYCDRNRLTPKERLELFMPVCQAIQHAHQKGIIHRDIKPTNVMVTLHDNKPLPKVIDFGVAKATAQRLTERTLFTQFGVIVGTPEYMSPEQSHMSGLDIDTRSDIYSLGVLLYELLTGTTPLEKQRLREAAFTEVLRRIREEQPPKPSTRLGTTQEASAIAAQRGTEPAKLARLMRGDLDWIVMRALEKDRTRRYESAGGLARDIKRHLEGDPVEAGPPSPLYRMTTFTRKHRIAIATAIAFAALLVLTVMITTLQAIRARRAEALANANMAKAQEGEAAAKSSEEEWEAVVGFFRDKILSATRPVGQDGGLGRDVKLSDVLDHAESSIADSFEAQPWAEARIRDALGLSYSYLGQPERSIKQFERSKALLEEKFGLEHSDTLVAMSSLSNAYHHAGRLSEAIPLFEQTIVHMDRVLGPTHLHTLATRNNLAGTYQEAGRIDDAILLHTQVVEAMKAKVGLDDINTLSCVNNLANDYRNAGRPAEALALHEDTLKRMRATLRPNHPNLLNCMSNLAIDYSDVGQIAESIALQEEALYRKRENPGPEHPDTLRTRDSLALAYQRAGRLADAISLEEETLKLAQRKMSPNHHHTLGFMSNLAEMYCDANRLADAIPLQVEALSIARTKLGPDHSDTLSCMNRLTRAYLDARRWTDAESTARECLKRREAKKPDDWLRYDTMSQLGAALAGERKYDEAEPLLIRGYDGIKAREGKIPAPRKKELSAARARVAALYDALGKPEKAASWRAKSSSPAAAPAASPKS